MVVASVSSPSCAGDNGMGSNVKPSPEFLSLLKQVDPDMIPENLTVQVLKAKLNRNEKHGKINVCIDILVRKKVVETEIELELYEENEFPMSEVIAVLVNHSSDYNIFRDNCYQYAYNMFRAVVKRFGIEVVQSEEKKATLQRDLDNHLRPVLLNDVFNERYVAGAVVGTGVAVAAVATAAVVNLPITLVGLYLAPKALCLTAGAISLCPAILIGAIATGKWWRCVKGSLVFWSRETKATLQIDLRNHPRPVLLNDVGTGVAAAVVVTAAVVYWPFTLAVQLGPVQLRTWILLCLLDGLDVFQIPAWNSYIAHSLNEKIGLFEMDVASVSSGRETHVDYSCVHSLLKQVEPDIEPQNVKVQVLKASIKAIRIEAFPENQGKPISHKYRFVTLELYSALLRHIFYVTAELNFIRANGVVKVDIDDCVRDLIADQVVETEIEVKLYEENEYPMSEVIDVLARHSSDYNILRDNYYQYAHYNMFRNVVKRFGIEVVGSSWEMKATLQRALDNHPRPVMIKDVGVWPVLRSALL